MRRTSGRAWAGKGRARAWAVPLIAGMLLASPSLAAAEPSGTDTIAELVAAVANADQKLQELGAAVQLQQESVNKALVDVQTARDAAGAAQAEVEASRRGVTVANAAIAAAQQRFDSYAAATYINGPSASYLTANDPADVIDTAAAGQTLATSAQQAIANLQRARTEQVNKESSARLAKHNADRAVTDAQSSQAAAVAELTQSQQTFGAQQTQLDQLTGERAAAQAKLNKAQTWSASAGSRPPSAAATLAGAPGDRWERGTAAPAPAARTAQWDTQWDPTLPAIPSAFVSGDPIAIINSILGMSATSSQVTADLGRGFLQQIGILKPADTGITNGRIPRVYGRQAAEYVIRRAGSQMGVPYSWGGGNAAGPSRGIDSGAGTVGFDCSGLMLYGFAGVGIKLDHYSGSQYNAGRKIPSAQMRRGDMLFWGPGGSQHVALYLGNGQMLEAPFTGSQVKISPVRTSGMTPYATRLIEY